MLFFGCTFRTKAVQFRSHLSQLEYLTPMENIQNTQHPLDAFQGREARVRSTPCRETKKSKQGHAGFLRMKPGQANQVSAFFYERLSSYFQPVRTSRSNPESSLHKSPKSQCWPLFPLNFLRPNPPGVLNSRPRTLRLARAAAPAAPGGGAAGGGGRSGGSSWPSLKSRSTEKARRSPRKKQKHAWHHVVGS